MKTTSITVERNFHILNDDRFIMEKISMTAEIDSDNEDIHEAANHLRNTITDNFKAAHPKIKIYLNFEPDQSGNFNYIEKVHATNEIEHGVVVKSPALVADAETIKKEIQSYKFGAKALKAIYTNIVKDNPELQQVFDEKLKELENAK